MESRVVANEDRMDDAFIYLYMLLNVADKLLEQ